MIDHLLLADDAHAWLSVVAFCNIEVLDLGHRVHRVHEGHVPTLTGQPADLAGQPVVRVDDVEPTFGATRLET